MKFTLPTSLFALAWMLPGMVDAKEPKVETPSPPSTPLALTVVDHSMCVDAWAVHAMDALFLEDLDASYPYGWTNELMMDGSPVAFQFFTEPDTNGTAVGKEVGSLVVAQSNGTDVVTFDFTAADGAYLEDVRLYVGGSELPEDKAGVAITSPSDFPFQMEDHDEPSLSLVGATAEANLYLMAHVTVCGPQFFEDAAKLSRRRRRPRRRSGRALLRGGAL